MAAAMTGFSSVFVLFVFLIENGESETLFETLNNSTHFM